MVPSSFHPLPPNTGSPLGPMSPATTMTTFVNNLQQQRLLHNSPSASLILQSLMNGQQRMRSVFEQAAAYHLTNGQQPQNIPDMKENPNMLSMALSGAPR